MQQPLLLVPAMLIAQQGLYVIPPLLLLAFLHLLEHVITPAVIMGNRLMLPNALPFLQHVVQTPPVIPNAWELILFKGPLAIATAQRSPVAHQLAATLP